MLLKKPRSEEHTSELQSRSDLVCRLLLEKKKKHGCERANTAPAVRLECRQRAACAICWQFRAGVGKSDPGHKVMSTRVIFFFFNDTATTEIYTLSLHDALPISSVARSFVSRPREAGSQLTRTR